MKARSSLLLLGVVVLAGSLLTVPSHAVASGCAYGASTIENPTNTTVHYEIRWGDGAWRRVCLYPGQTYSHWSELDEYGQAPIPQIRFDWIAGDGLTTYRTYDLQVYATSYPRSGGKRYYFGFSSCGTYLNLYQR